SPAPRRARWSAISGTARWSGACPTRRRSSARASPSGTRRRRPPPSSASRRRRSCRPSAPRSRSTTSGSSRWPPPCPAPARPTSSWSWRRSSTPPSTSASPATSPTTSSSRRSRGAPFSRSSPGCIRRSFGTWSPRPAGPAPPRCTSSNQGGFGRCSRRRSGPRSGGPSSSASSSRSGFPPRPRSSASGASRAVPPRFERRRRVRPERLVERGHVPGPEPGVAGPAGDHVPVVVLGAHPVLGRDRAVSILVVQVLPLVDLQEHVQAAPRPLEVVQLLRRRVADVHDAGKTLVLDQQFARALREHQRVVMRLAAEQLGVLLHLDVLCLELAVDREERDAQRRELQCRPEPLRARSEERQAFGVDERHERTSVLLCPLGRTICL